MPSETCNVSDGIFYPAGICSDSIAAVFNQPGQPFQREGDRLRADGFAVAVKTAHCFATSARKGKPEPNRADGFAFAAARAGDAGNTDGVIRLSHGFRAARHLIDGLAADRAVFEQGFGQHAQAVFFGFVAVCYKTLVEPLRTACNACECGAAASIPPVQDSAQLTV